MKVPCQSTLYVTPDLDTFSPQVVYVCTKEEGDSRQSGWVQRASHVPHHILHSIQSRSVLVQVRTSDYESTAGLGCIRMSSHCSACAKIRDSTQDWRYHRCRCDMFISLKPNTPCQSRKDLAVEVEDAVSRIEMCACTYIGMRVAECPASMC
jgi:hypothetical protein